MPSKIVYNINSTSQDHAVLIDVSNMPQNNSYWTFGDLISDGNKKSNFRIFFSIAIFIIVLLLGYSTCHLTSPDSKNHEILSDGNKHFNDTKMMIQYNETNLNITSSTKENVTKTLNSTTEISIHTTSENTESIVTQRTMTTVTSGTVTTVTRLTTVTPVTEATTEIATQQPPNEMLSCLNNFTNRFEEINSTIPEKCIEEPIGIKSTIIFYPSSSKLFECLIFKNNKCDKSFHHDRYIDVEYNNLKHIRYNFVMGDYGNLYQGRPLSCSMDDTISFGYNNSQILIGMPACHYLDSYKALDKLKFFYVVRNLTNCLSEEGVLSETYTMEFDNKCRHYLVTQFEQFYGQHLQFFNKTLLFMKFP